MFDGIDLQGPYWEGGARARLVEEFPHGRLVAVHLPGVSGQLTLSQLPGEDKVV